MHPDIKIRDFATFIAPNQDVFMDAGNNVNGFDTIMADDATTTYSFTYTELDSLTSSIDDMYSTTKNTHSAKKIVHNRTDDFDDEPASKYKKMGSTRKVTITVAYPQVRKFKLFEANLKGSINHNIESTEEACGEESFDPSEHLEEKEEATAVKKKEATTDDFIPFVCFAEKDKAAVAKKRFERKKLCAGVEGKLKTCFDFESAANGGTMSSPNNASLDTDMVQDDSDDASSTIVEVPTTPRQTKASIRAMASADASNKAQNNITTNASSTTFEPPSTPKPTKSSIQEHDIAFMAAKQAPKHTDRAHLTRDMSSRDHAAGACYTMRFDDHPFVSDEEFEGAYTLTRLHRVYVVPGRELLPNEDLEEERRKLGIVVDAPYSVGDGQAGGFGGPLDEGDGDVFMS